MKFKNFQICSISIFDSGDISHIIKKETELKMHILAKFTALYTVLQGFANTKKNLDWLIIDRMMHLVANLGTANFSIWSSF